MKYFQKKLKIRNPAKNSGMATKLKIENKNPFKMGIMNAEYGKWLKNHAN